MSTDALWNQLQHQANLILGLKDTKGSGNVHGDSDGKDDRYINECKYRESRALTIPRDEWQKLEKEAAAHGRIPIFTVIRPGDKGEGPHVFYSMMRTTDLGRLLGSAGSLDSKDEKHVIRKVFWKVFDRLFVETRLSGLNLKDMEKLQDKAHSILESLLKR